METSAPTPMVIFQRCSDGAQSSIQGPDLLGDRNTLYACVRVYANVFLCALNLRQTATSRKCHNHLTSLSVTLTDLLCLTQSFVIIHKHAKWSRSIRRHLCWCEEVMCFDHVFCAWKRKKIKTLIKDAVNYINTTSSSKSSEIQVY